MQVVHEVLEACRKLPSGPQPPVMPDDLYRWKKDEEKRKAKEAGTTYSTMTTMNFTMTATMTEASLKLLNDTLAVGQLEKDPRALPNSWQGIVNAQVCAAGYGRLIGGVMVVCEAVGC